MELTLLPSGSCTSFCLGLLASLLIPVLLIRFRFPPLAIRLRLYCECVENPATFLQRLLGDLGEGLGSAV